LITLKRQSPLFPRRSRGAKEDKELELEFRRICDGANFFRKPLPFDIIIVDKKTNSEGLQLADLTARPIGLSVLRGVKGVVSQLRTRQYRAYKR
jgi:hypothetical protein